MLSKQVGVAVGMFEIEPSVVTVVAIVSVIVEDADKVVSTSSVPVVVRTVVPADEVDTVVPSEVIAVL